MELKYIQVKLDESKIYRLIEEIQNELKYKNRFQNNKLDKIIDYILYAEANLAYMRKGMVLYRARIYTKPDAQEKFALKNAEAFNGYDKENSFINKHFDLVSEGRCNPKWIPYLYASKSAKCCIHEVRPKINDFVSVAKLKINSGLKIIDLSCSSAWYMRDGYDEIIPGISNHWLCIYIGDLFSTPYQHENDYLITQYISEKIKNAGYDGIAYKSSLYDGNNDINFVVFNYDKCEVISSELYRITALDVRYERSKQKSKK